MRVFLFALMLAFLTPVATQAQSGASYADACRAWLAAVDAGKYDESWDMAGPYFQSKVTKGQWYAMAQPVRAALGPVVSRGSAQVTPAEILPNAPFGKYMVIVIRTKFAMNDNATETIFMKMENSEWKVAGYFVK